MRSEDFAAERSEQIEEATESISEAVREALVRWKAEGELDTVGLQELVEVFWLENFSAEAPNANYERFLPRFSEILAESLGKTSPPAGDEPSDLEVMRISTFLVTLAINDGTFRGAGARGVSLKRWVSTHDSSVRESHRGVHGQIRPIGEPFLVDGVEIQYPGQPVGPPDVWIGCRCVLQPAARGEASMSRTTLNLGEARKSSLVASGDEEYSTAGVFLIPEASDPIVSASSEQAHLTTVWLGEMEDISEDEIAAIRDEVAAYSASLSGPVVVPVTEQGELGDDGAIVAFLEPTEALLALRDGLIEQSPTLRSVMERVKQFPQWTPHVTLGYPESPALAEYDGEAVSFDRVGLWIGPEQENYDMGETDTLTASSEVVSGEDETEEEVEEEVTEIPVHGVAVVEGVATGDGRGFRPGAISLGKMPQPLGYEYVSTHGGDTSNVAIVGRIDEYWREEVNGVIELRWRGVILTTKEYAAKAIESIIDGSYTGLSVIVDSITVDVDEEREALRNRLTAEGEALGEGEKPTEEEIERFLDEMIGDGTIPVTWFTEARVRRFDMVPTGAFQEAYIGLGHEFPDELTEEQLVAAAAALEECGCGESAAEEGFAPGTKDGPGWVTHPQATSRIRNYWTKGEGAAKIAWGTPGDFNRCRAQLAKYVENPDWLAGLCANMHKEAVGVWPGQERHSVTASAGEAVAPAPLFSLVASLEPVDASYFQRRELSNPRVGMIVDGDAIYGYIAQWNVCHIGISNGCTMAPRSPSGYAYYRTGSVITTEGPVNVGQITMDTGHAKGDLSAHAAVSHYDNTGAVVADVVTGEDRFGIWFAGRIRPGVSDEKRYALAASGRLSGDWRRVGNKLELVAALCVNVPGFPIPDVSLSASAAGPESLVAAGVICPDQEGAAPEILDAIIEPVDIEGMVESAVARALSNRDQQERSKKVNEARLQLARQIIKISTK